MSGHTEQWRWEEPVDLIDGGQSRCLVTTTGVPVLRHEGRNWTVSEENRAIIAAAPAMYEALTRILRAIPMGDICCGDCRPGIGEHEDDCPIEHALAALAAADGPGKDGGR